ncbi:MAG: amino acid adenylation domain-containing protein [Acidimicrobiia bacterium]|nr:amino acid adenylation domain-containing protein [Acidimicrobiia bacterium]
MTSTDDLRGYQVETLGELLDGPSMRARGVDVSADALTDGTTSLTWLEYIDRVGHLAGALAAAGVRRGDRVAVNLHKSAESFVAVHAVLRTGAVMVPLDPLAPPDLATELLVDSDAEVLVSDAAPDRLALLCERTLVRTVLSPAADDPNPSAAGSDITMVGRAQIASSTDCGLVAVDPDEAAYIIYTSGSTGRPKGIVHSHRSALAYATTAACVYGLDRDDRLANVAPLHFDQSTFELYAAPLAGSIVLVVPEPHLRFPASLSELIERERITVWYSVPYLLAQLSTRGVLDERDLSTLRWVLFGGEVFPPSQLAGLMRQLPGARFSNVYGPAEVNQCTIHNLPGPPTGDAAVPIGGAWPGAEIELVEPDDPHTAVPRGAPGVLIVRTPTMMTGYWHRPDLTSATIVERRTADGSTEHWYRTGDLAVERDGGDLEFLGRLDNQVKLRGYRIELEAIDVVLGDIDLLSAGTVILDVHEDGEDRLIALVVPRTAADRSDVDSQDAVSASVLAELRARLPRYAVPAEVRLVQSLPRTATGKIDRIAARELIDLPTSAQSSEPKTKLNGGPFT